MAIELKMPQLSDTMHSGKIVAWYKKEGDSVERGEAIAEVETDKANLQIESFHKGTLVKILAPVNHKANVGEVIAYVGQPGETVGTTTPATVQSPIVTTQLQVQVTPPPVTATPPPPQPIEIPQPPRQSFSPTEIVADSSGRIKASPLARKIAQEKNIDLALIRGSGPEGRIVRKDVECSDGSAARKSEPLSSPTSPAPQFVQSSTATTEPFSRMRETIARRMQESVRESPHFYTTVTIDMDEASRLREALKERAEYKGITINHLVMKACAYAMVREPRVNRAVKDNQVFSPGAINIGIITAIEDGLLIPVIKDCDKLSLRDLVFEARAAVERARAGRPNSTDLSGGTFSISNMGMLDVDQFTAIINPGQGAVLAVASTQEVPVVRRGQIVIGKTLKATLSVDHRVIDGVMSGTWLKYFKEALELPALLLA